MGVGGPQGAPGPAIGRRDLPDRAVSAAPTVAHRRLVRGRLRCQPRRVIPEVDAALEALIRRDVLNGTRVDVLFDAPTKDWVARRNAPAINLYLYDIREDLARREVAYVDVRDTAGIVAERRQPPRRFKLSYLATAWTQRPEDEHRLLAAMLASFVANEILPPDMLTGVLADSALPVIVTVAQPPTQDRSIADVWSALGGELKPSLDVSIVAPLEVRRVQEAAKPVLGVLGLEMRGPGTAERAQAGRAGGGRGRFGGRPLGPGDEAAQDETVFGERGPKAPDEGSEAAAGGSGKRGTAAAAASGTAENESPGRRIRMRGISRP